MLRYYCECVSDYYESLVRIEIHDSQYSGDPVIKPMIGPVLSWSEGRIKTASLRMRLECETEGELEDLYTTDMFRYRVVALKDGDIIYHGYLHVELYSQVLMAEPYDIDVTSSDLLEVLKDQDFKLKGRMSLMSIIQEILSFNKLDLNIVTRLDITNVSQTGEFLLVNSIWADTFADKSMYEALEGILETINAYLVQRNNKYYIYRESADKCIEYDADFNKIGEWEQTAIEMGDQGYPVFPSGTLSMEKSPAKKSVLVTYSPIYRSLLDNALCEEDRAWVKEGRVNPPGNYTDRDGKEVYQKYYRIFSAIPLTVGRHFISQGFPCEGLDNVQMTMHMEHSCELAGPEEDHISFKLFVVCKKGNSNVALLEKDGQFEWTAYDYEPDFKGINVNTCYNGSRNISVKTDISFVMPAGCELLDVTIENKYLSKRGTSGNYQDIVFRIYECSMNTGEGLPEDLSVETSIETRAAKKMDDIELSFADAVVSGYTGDYLSYNYLHYQGRNTLGTKWKIFKIQHDTFMQMMAYDAKIENKRVRNIISGSVFSRYLEKEFRIDDILYNKKYSLTKLECSLFDDIYSITLIEDNIGDPPDPDDTHIVQGGISHVFDNVFGSWVAGNVASSGLSGIVFNKYAEITDEISDRYLDSKSGKVSLDGIVSEYGNRLDFHISGTYVYYMDTPLHTVLYLRVSAGIVMLSPFGGGFTDKYPPALQVGGGGPVLSPANKQLSTKLDYTVNNANYTWNNACYAMTVIKSEDKQECV